MKKNLCRIIYQSVNAQEIKTILVSNFWRQHYFYHVFSFLSHLTAYYLLQSEKPIGIPIKKKAKTATETHSVTSECKIRKCSI